jgi:glycosyltransferase involved in cell wall biosynthesis
MSSPQVSVIIPAFNVAAYIAEALASVFEQSYTDFEVIVVNDGSPDTEELEAAIEPFRSRILYLKQERRRGVSAARNLAIQHARGEFLAFLDGDDAWFPHCLAAQMEAFQLDPGLDMISADLELFGAGAPVGRTAMSLNGSERPVTLASLVRQRSVPLTSTVVVRRRAVIEAGLFDPAFSLSEDFDLWLRLARCGCRIDLHPDVVGKRRVHSGAASYRYIPVQKAIVTVLDKLVALGLPPDDASVTEAARAAAVAALRYLEGRWWLLEGDYAKAAEALREAAPYCGALRARLLLAGLRLAPRLTRLAAWLVARRSGAPAPPLSTSRRAGTP